MIGDLGKLGNLTIGPEGYIEQNGYRQYADGRIEKVEDIPMGRMKVTKEHIGKRVLMNLNNEIPTYEGDIVEPLLHEAIIQEISPSGKYFKCEPGGWHFVEDHPIIEVLPKSE